MRRWCWVTTMLRFTKIFASNNILNKYWTYLVNLCNSISDCRRSTCIYEMRWRNIIHTDFSPLFTNKSTLPITINYLHVELHVMPFSNVWRLMASMEWSKSWSKNTNLDNFYKILFYFKPLFRYWNETIVTETNKRKVG